MKGFPRSLRCRFPRNDYPCPPGSSQAAPAPVFVPDGGSAFAGFCCSLWCRAGCQGRGRSRQARCVVSRYTIPASFILSWPGPVFFAGCIICSILPIHIMPRFVSQDRVPRVVSSLAVPVPLMMDEQNSVTGREGYRKTLGTKGRFPCHSGPSFGSGRPGFDKPVFQAPSLNNYLYVFSG